MSRHVPPSGAAGGPSTRGAEVAVGEVEILVPVVGEDVVSAGAEVVADGVADGVVGGGLGGDAETFLAVEGGGARRIVRPCGKVTAVPAGACGARLREATRDTAGPPFSRIGEAGLSLVLRESVPHDNRDARVE